MTTATDARLSLPGVTLHYRDWPGKLAPPFLLVHGLASNARTWDGVAAALNAAGHRVVAIDQRGHGESDRPDGAYTFHEVDDDLAALIGQLGLDRPVIAGQSWGGNVVLEFAQRYPGLVSAIVLVDGGFIELAADPDSTWEVISERLRPPSMHGIAFDQLETSIRNAHPDWSDEGIAGTMANLERLPDGTARARLPLEYHMRILRSLYDQRPSQIFPQLTLPVMIAVADQPMGSARKRDRIDAVEPLIQHGRIRWFEDTHHDIHVQRPAELAGWMLDALADGFIAIDRAHGTPHMSQEQH